MFEKFTIEDEHRAGIRTYRLLAGDRIIARGVLPEFVNLLASAGLLLAACETALPIIEDEADRRDEALQDDGAYWTEMRVLADQLQSAISAAGKSNLSQQPEVISYL